MHILVPVDDSDPAREALEWAADTYPDATITALHVVKPALWGSGSGESNPYEPQLPVSADDERLEGVFDRARTVADERGVDLSTAVLVGSPARAAVRFAADEEVDLIVVGSHGRTGVSRVLLGSVAETIVRRAPVAVTVVR
ncbi:universal stress protein [Halobiforma nitratireducens]|uniref:UspA domain-containing protein n=1 Tax=Halobiforma nitratireducens JCM 10879 TaxID=1227454 RepID=M0LW10_9EURY|nr:universal stress protein [Halobiforma nitratireducens]EMA37348.1 UspA domain-containing protein [Halobiforma nitratireducens JCM 10879]